MPRICKAPKCNYPVFSNNFCRYHQYLRTDEKHLMAVSKQRSWARGGNIPKKSDSRLKDEITYKKICDEIDREALAKGEFNCFFCGEEIRGRATHHHTLGRDNDLFTDKKWIVLGHFRCHDDYHSKAIEFLTWYEDFLQRLKEFDSKLYDKELKKQDK